MPRDLSGTYTLPAGNPVVTGTIIDVAWANPTMADIAIQLNNVMTRSGILPATADMPLGGFKLTGVADGIALQDAVTIKQYQNGSPVNLSAVAGTDTITATLTSMTAYTAGMQLTLIAANTNTGATTINVNSLGAKNITKNGNTALATGDLVAGGAYILTYDGTQFQCSGGVGSGSAFVPEVQTATAGQTVFTLANGYTVGSSTLNVYVNGLMVNVGTDYAETSTNVVTFSAGLTAGDEVKFIVWRTNIASYGDAGTMSFIQAGTGAVARTVQDKARESVSVIDFGASTGNTNAQNKTALQAAIAAVSEAGGGRVVVPNGINYGYKRTDNTTWPDFSSLTTGDVVVIDNGVGNSYTSPAKDGAQIREFYGTKQTPTPGQHDGNGHWVRGNWHPYIYLSNDNPSAAGGNSDPYRASIFWTVNGNNPNLGWRLGQRDVSFNSTGTTNEQYSGFGLSCDGNFVYQGGSSWYANGTMVMGVSRYYGTWGFNAYPDTSAAYNFYLPHGIPSVIVKFKGDTAAELPRLSLEANGTTNRVQLNPGSGLSNYDLDVAGTNVLRFDTGGHVHIGPNIPSNARNSINGAYAEGAMILQMYSTSTTDTFDAYSVASFGANVAACAVQFGKNSSTSRSINAGGTINASGADYAEYELNNGLKIDKGQIVGFKADGTLTLTFAEAVRFGVKSTNPSYVGGDTWGSEDVVGKRPEEPSFIPDEYSGSGEPMPPIAPSIDSESATAFYEEAKVAYEAKLLSYASDMAEHAAAVEDAKRVFDSETYPAYVRSKVLFDSAMELARQKVDRIAYSGKVPCNVFGAIAGGYIIAVDNAGAIAGEFVADPDFSQYKKSVGRVNRIFPDGRCEVAVIIH